ncbi:MAG: NADPH-dependent glutamate synthase [Nitrospirae bacterium]|nr:NADPH-dependent glutamate synthase [Nitrospirota bacterium]
MTEVKKKKIIPNKTPIPEQPANIRRSNFSEVALGYTEADARLEASRCLACKQPKCVEGCPVNVPIRDFIGFINKGDFSGAINKIKEQNFLPAVCGRVCPQEDQCEKNCVVGKKNEPVGIGRLERFAADWERTQGTAKKITVKNPTGKKVAIVGSGPSGLTAAFDLAKEGHKVTIFEALHQAGGVLVYGIPEFRLPKSIVAKEIETLKEMGVEIALNSVIGKLFTVDELMKDFDACYIGTGAGLPKFMGIPGENLNGVYSANEFLTRANLMKAFSFPEYDTPIRTGKRLAVVGGGNVAMDSARTALRLGLEESMIIYRRSLAEMPARAEEVHHAKEEGVRFEMLTNPIRIIGKDGWVNAIECERMELGEPDASGRRKPVRIKGSEFQIAVDAVIIAVGTSANPLVPQSAADLKTTKWGYIIADEQTGLTSMKGVYAGGDIVTGSATVILAMGAGRKAASAISQYLAAK